MAALKSPVLSIGQRLRHLAEPAANLCLGAIDSRALGSIGESPF
jgi:hypothetical protein